MSSNKSKRDAKLVDQLKREDEVLRLRRQGLTWRMIGDELGYKNGSAPFKIWQKAYKRVLERTNETVDEHRWNEVGRIEAIMRGGLFARAQKGELQAIDRFIALQKALRELRGLDAPKQLTVEHSGPVAETAAEINAAVRTFFGEHAAVPADALNIGGPDAATEPNEPGSDDADQSDGGADPGDDEREDDDAPSLSPGD